MGFLHHPTRLSFIYDGFDSPFWRTTEIMNEIKQIRDKTISDFGEQWTKYVTNDGFYASQELFSDILGPLLSFSDIKNKNVLDIGSGTGRIAMMLLEAGVSHVTAVEPSKAFEVLKKKLAPFAAATPSRLSVLNCAGDEIPESIKVDFAFSIGVLHHIPEPDPVVKAVYKTLDNGGKFVIWLYGKENNRSYLFFVEPLRNLTKILPHTLLVFTVWLLYFPLIAYGWVCKWVKLPLRDYLCNVLMKMSPDKRRLVIYDQLNPAYAKYYTSNEAKELLLRNGFMNVELHHRRGYSWTVIGEKP